MRQPGHEHALVEQLLADAKKKRPPFDAIMVADVSRWSRDNAHSASGLALLRTQGIRFFALGKEWDLYDPTDFYFVSHFVIMNAMQAGVQKLKSVQNKIGRAKAGRPVGNLPYGRTFDKASGTWGLDPDKVALIKDAAKRYLAGEPLRTLAKEMGMDHTSLHDIRHRCGSKFVQTFDVPDLKIHEVIETKVPLLLPPQTIKAIAKRMAQRSKQGGRGNNKHDYLLGGYVRCDVCCRCLSPTVSGGTRYYRPAVACKCLGGNVRADQLERIVLVQLASVMGDPKRVQEAVAAAKLAQADGPKTQAEIDAIDKKLGTIKRSRGKLLKLLESDLVPEDEVLAKLAPLRDQETKLQDRHDTLSASLATGPRPGDVAKAAKRAKRRIQIAKMGTTADELGPANAVALIREAFDGHTTPDGRPSAVYINKTDRDSNRRPRPWSYTLRCSLPGWAMNGGATDWPEDVFDGSSVGEDDLVNALGEPLPTPSQSKVDRYRWCPRPGLWRYWGGPSSPVLVARLRSGRSPIWNPSPA